MVLPFVALSRYVLQNKPRPSGLQRSEHIQSFLKCELISLRQFRTLSPNSFNFNMLYRYFKESLLNAKPNFIFLLWANQIQHLPSFLKSSSVSVVKNCLEQIEFVLAYRIRRGQQMVTLYTRMWEDKALRQLFKSFRRMFQRKGKHLMYGATFLGFDWNRERIPLDEMKKHKNELDICYSLRKKAVKGGDDPGTVCEGPDCQCPECDSTVDVHCWEPFIQQPDLTVWKMEEIKHKGKGLYCYKMYGRYTDVTADDFLEVFLDTDNRTKWDTHCATLKVIDSEPSSNSDVIYWETKWPTMFSNRDYVFKRRFYKDTSAKIIVVMNKSTQHPLYPPLSSKSRVKEYWSYMVIKSQKDFNKPGIEFSLTYFDNPGISLPSAISLWVTVQGMPEYLKRLRREALAIKKQRDATGGRKEGNKKLKKKWKKTRRESIACVGGFIPRHIYFKTLEFIERPKYSS